MLSSQTWFLIMWVVAPLCAVGSIITVIMVIREELRGGGNDEEAPEAPLRDAMPRDGKAGLPGSFRRQGRPQVVPASERREDLRMERVPV